MGAASATPQPVPALMAVNTRLREDAASPAATSEKGGNARPALAPATRRPANRTPALSAPAAISIPTVAKMPPAMTTARAPMRRTRAAALTDAAMYATYDAAESTPSAPDDSPNAARISGASSPNP